MQWDCKLATVGLKETGTPSKCRAKSEAVERDTSSRQRWQQRWSPERRRRERGVPRLSTCRLDSWMWRFRYCIQVHRPSCSVAAKVRDLPLPKLMRRLGSASQPRKFKYLAEHPTFQPRTAAAVISWGRNYGSSSEDDDSDGGRRE